MAKQVSAGKLKASILSLSLLTVMAGAAVSPALGAIQAYFSDVNVLAIRMIVSMPALFICLTSFIFPHLTKKFGTKQLVVFALLLYLASGMLAALCNNIALILVLRALLGVSVGIIMPLSTGLLAFYFSPQEQPKLMGLSSAMNNVGGVIGTLLAGVLSSINWRMSFLVYIMGLITVVLCFTFLPNASLHKRENADGKPATTSIGKTFRANYIFVIAMFLQMALFYLYPVNFALEVKAAGIIPPQYISIIMAVMNLMGFFSGLLFARMRMFFKSTIKVVPAVFFGLGYIFLAMQGGLLPTIIGSVLVGFGCGMGVPMIISEASKRAGKAAAATVMPLLSAGMYLGQFLSPIIMSAVTAVVGDMNGLPYYWGIILAIVYFIWCIRIKINIVTKNS